MSTGMVTWSTTAATNASADSSVNWAEGQAPSSVNDSARAMMASVAKWLADNNGSITTGGTSTAYTVTTNQVFGSLTAGLTLRVKFHTACGASPTFAPDGLLAKPLAKSALIAIAANDIATGAVETLVYDGAEWVLVGSTSGSFASGTAMLFVQSAAPTGWTKSVTHNDKALRIVSGTAGSGGTTVFSQIFGARTITQANLPNVTLTTNITDPGHNHNIHGGTTQGGGIAGSMDEAGNTVGTDTTAIFSAFTGITASTPLGGSGTAMDFNVTYVDAIIATKD